MKRLAYIALGIFIGVSLTISAGAYAASSGLIGKKVTSEVDVNVNGSKIADRGAVVDGRTYLPVRTIANILGASTSYESGEVLLTTSTKVTENEDEEQRHIQITLIQNRISEIDEALARGRQNLQAAQNLLNGALSDPKAAESVSMYQWMVDQAQTSISKLEQEKADLETKLNALQNQ